MKTGIITDNNGEKRELSAQIDNLCGQYHAKFGSFPEVEPIPMSGGDRRYFRLRSSKGPTVIGTTGRDPEENRCFIELAASFNNIGVAVPQIYSCSDDLTCYLQEDLGSDTLLPLLSGEDRMALSEKSLVSLAEMQTAEESVWGSHVNNPAFSERMVMWDLNYFKYEFLKPCGITFNEDRLEDDFEKMAKDVAVFEPSLWGFMYRDFQSRNVMIKDGKPYFIDFQGGRKGPLLYDAVSFLWQAKAGFSRGEREKLLDVYAASVCERRGVPKGQMLARVGRMALLRTLQVLGAYGFRGLIEKRAHFIESIPAALGNLSDLMADGVVDCYPELKKACRMAVESRFGKNVADGRLSVSVFSFSYKKGYPEDLSGNGGGFIFDCRGMHNPGRYDEYKSLTGLDEAVIDFLERRGEARSFVNKALDIVRPSVCRYLKRGFSSLQVGFGCTGGRHRSVYCAVHLAEMLAKEYPEARIVLNHREQGITTIYNNGGE